MKASILILDDNSTTAQTLQPLLSQEGYRVDCMRPGAPALEHVANDPPGLVLLGITDGVAGWRFCHQLLCHSQTPVILLLASDRELDRVRGLSLGAADCLSKSTLGSLELLARIGAVLRRDASRGAGQPISRTAFTDGDLVIDLAHRGGEICLAGRYMALTPIERRIVACFLAHVGQLFSAEELLLETWGPGHRRTVASLWPHIHNLRRKLEPDPGHPRRLITRPRRGYLLQRIAVDWPRDPPVRR